MLFCNIIFNQKNINALFESIQDNKPKLIVTVNAAFIVEANKSKRFFDILKKNYVTFDGRIPYLTAKSIYFLKLILNLFFTKNKKKHFEFDFEKLSGSDLVYDFCKFSEEKKYKIFFLGGREKSNRGAVHAIKERYNIVIDGYSPCFEDYPFSDHFNQACLAAIEEFKPDILFVGFGAPKQEYWVDDNMSFLSEIGVKYIIGCGGTFDFISGSIKRAPVFMQKIGIESVYRFFQEPNKTRFMRLIDSIKFFKYIFEKPDFMRN